MSWATVLAAVKRRLYLFAERAPYPSAALWMIGAALARPLTRRGTMITDGSAAEFQARLASDALGAGLAESEVTVFGPDAHRIAKALNERGFSSRRATERDQLRLARSVVLSGAERFTPRTLRALFRQLSHKPLVIVCPPLWPSGRTAALNEQGIKLLRPREWWYARAEEAGLTEALTIRRGGGDRDALVFGTTTSPGFSKPPSSREQFPAAPDVVVRINDDLSSGVAFSWCSASIALALDELGVNVSIAPTALSPSFGPQRLTRLQGLLEREGARTDADAEVGWTHFWPKYHRPLRGRTPVPLFAVNYCFRQQAREGFDPWIRSLVEGGGPVAPISTFCREVLVDAGIAPGQLPIVPMAVTDGLVGQSPGTLPGARTTRLLHITNAFDLERNGTDLALNAFAETFAPGDDVTLIVRDYASRSSTVDQRVAALAASGRDVRYWPVFYPEPPRLARFLGAFDALLAPFRGEGFGIKILDAMACGVPPICPFFGGPTDFVDATVAYNVAYDLAPVTVGRPAEQLTLGNEPMWAECQLGSIAAALRAVADDPAEARRRGAAARDRALGHFTWQHTAQRVLKLVTEASSP
jgi:Family 4 Glycosyltransferase in conflict systems